MSRTRLLANIDRLAEKYGRLPHEILALDRYALDILLACNRARLEEEEEEEEGEGDGEEDGKGGGDDNDDVRRGYSQQEEYNRSILLKYGLLPEPEIRVLA